MSLTSNQTFFSLVGNSISRIVATITGGSASAYAIPCLNALGVLDVSVMPTGIDADVFTALAGSALSANQAVCVINASGAASIVPADASNGRAAWGFVTSAVGSGATATVCKYGTIAGQTGLTIGGIVYLGTAGALTQSPASTTGYILQAVGIASSATTVEFEPGIVIQL